jgi:hypothetical protein
MDSDGLEDEAEPVDVTTQLTGAEGGVWRVTTASTTHYIFDLNEMNITRVPGLGAAVTINDTTRRIDSIERCRTGDTGYWTMRPGAEDSVMLQDYWQLCTRIESIERIDRLP